MDLEYLASVGILGYQSGLWPSPCESQPSAAGAENEVDIAEQDLVEESVCWFDNYILVDDA